MEGKPEGGVCYFSRIPSGMSVADIRRYFSAEGVARIFLRPYPRGRGPRRYRDGYAEFPDAQAAAAVAAAFNGRPVGGSKGNRFFDDLWSLRFVPELRWSQLADRRRQERRVAEHRVRAELRQAARVHNHIAGQQLLRSIKCPKEI